MLNYLPEAIEAYANEHTTPLHEAFDALTAHTQANTDMPQMQVGRVEGTFLKLLVRSIGATRVLEIGTFTGYSALAMADGLPDGGEVITCDIDREATAIAREFWAKHPAGERISLKLGRALDTIDALEGPFDLVFIDADKASYIEYWEACVPKVRPHGLILADNVLWSGKVLDPQEPDDHAIVAFNEHVAKDDRVDLVTLTVRDGVVLACKR
jgi:caffeoyl-CoA O-methyltransferase